MKKTDLQERTELATHRCAKSILEAPRAHILKEPPACLMELIEVTLEHLGQMKRPGTARLTVGLTIMKSELESAW